MSGRSPSSASGRAARSTAPRPPRARSREADVVVGYGPYLDQCADLLDGPGGRARAHGGGDARAPRRRSRAPARARAWRSCPPATPACTAWRRGRSRSPADTPVEVVPGVTAALAAAARLGAPLADDWATLSLSDLHVPWATVERRLTALAASGSRSRSTTRARRPAPRRSSARSRSCASTARRTRRSPSPPTSRAPARRSSPRRSPRSTRQTVTMRSLVLVAGDSGAWAGQWLVARREARRDRASRRRRARRPGAAHGRRGRAAARRARVVVYDRPSMDAIVALAPAERRAPLRRARARARGRCAQARGQRAADRARPRAATSCGSRAAIRSSPRAAPRRPSRCARRGSTCTSSRASRPRSPRPPRPGIPLMLRQLSVTATFVDGNDDDEHAEPPDWAALARLGGTLVILTGRGRIRRTAAALIAGGRDPETPVAAISAAARDRPAGAARHARGAPRPAAPARDLRRRPRRRARPMHIPDGFLTGEAALLGTATAAAGARRLPARRARGACASATCRSPGSPRRSSSSPRRRWCRSRSAPRATCSAARSRSRCSARGRGR